MSFSSCPRAFVWLEQLGQDGRYAWRQFGRTKAFSAVIIAILALGIGATTAIYSVVDAVLLHPIPGPAADRLVQVGEWIQFSNRPNPDRMGLSPKTGEALAAEAGTVFEEVAWADGAQLDRRGDEFSTVVFGDVVSENFFTLFGAKPRLGRGFAPGEAVPAVMGRPQRETVIVLSDEWWRTDFGADPRVLGTTIELSGLRYTIVGVMPAHFQFPLATTKYWIPGEAPQPQPRSIGGANLKLFGRLKPGVMPEQLQARLDVIAQRLMQDNPETDRTYGSWWRRMPGGLRLWGLPLTEMLQSNTYTVRFDELRRTLLGFFAAIGFVLAIVCANVASLTLARTERREHELAVRAALGAGRGRLTRQLLTENLLLALAGGVVGLGVTHWAIKVLAAFSTMPRLRPIEVDARVFGIALLTSLGTGLLFGLVPAWLAGRTQVNRALQQGGFSATAGRRGSRIRSALVVLEVALAVVLLTGAGLMIQSVVRLLRVDPGFDPVNLVTVSPSFTGLSVPNLKERRETFLAQLRERLAALPGVSAVGLFKDNYQERKFVIEDRGETVLLYGAHVGVEEADYFRTARIALVSGRLLGRGDVGENTAGVVVNETLAERCWPGQNALGKTFRAIERRQEKTYEVVGVVRDARLDRLDETARALFYRPFAESDVTGMPDRLMVRTERDPAPLIAAMRQEIRALFPGMRTPWIGVFRQILFDATAAQRTYRNYLVVFAATGLLLAALGVYGVLAYAVARRTREIGIRMALGANRRSVMNLVMGEGSRLIATGIVVGLVASFWLTQLLQKQLFGVSPHDLGVQAAVVLTLAAVGLIACWLPARRAARIEPMIALRTE